LFTKNVNPYSNIQFLAILFSYDYEIVSNSCGNVCLFLQFLCIRNIRAFLHACQDVFGLKESELFDPYDLFDIRDFGKVYLLYF